MKRLRGGDAQHLYHETATEHRHTMKVVVLGPSAHPDGYSFERLREHLAAQAARLAPLRWRLVRVPLSLFHPLWADQGGIEPGRHVHRVTVPAPGGPRELCEVVSGVAGTPLDRAHPLWEVWVVEGLDHGGVALVFKIHHALADGRASVRLLTEILDGGGDAPAAPEGVPPPLARILGSVGPLLRLAAGLPALLVRTARLAPRPGRRFPQEALPAEAFSAPRTRFNHRLTPGRTYACVAASLGEVKAIKNAFGCTVNDVVLAAVGGAVRDYLQSHRELPARTLTACVPVSVWSEADSREWGNRLSNMFTPLHTDVADPVQRLRAVQRSMQTAKRRHDSRDPLIWDAWWEYYPLVSAYFRAVTWLGTKLTGRPPYSLIVSNVRGPSRPLRCAGAPVVAIHSVGVVSEDLGLNVTVWSYLDRLSFGVVGCPEHLPDVWALAERIPEQVAELYRAASREGLPDGGPENGFRFAVA